MFLTNIKRNGLKNKINKKSHRIICEIFYETEYFFIILQLKIFIASDAKAKNTNPARAYPKIVFKKKHNAPNKLIRISITKFCGNKRSVNTNAFL